MITLKPEPYPVRYLIRKDASQENFGDRPAEILVVVDLERERNQDIFCNVTPKARTAYVGPVRFHGLSTLGVRMLGLE